MENKFLTRFVSIVRKVSSVLAFSPVVLCLLLSSTVYGSNTSALDYLSKYPFTSLPLPAVLREQASNITQLNEVSLEWKDLWEDARTQARKGNFAEAANSYKRLFLIKKVLEAHWELACVLVALGENEQAYEIIEDLYEEYTERPDYVNGLAVMSMKTKRYERGAELFSKLLQRDSKNINAMAGAAYGFLVSGKEKDALPFMELLWQEKSLDQELREIIIVTSCQSGELLVARRFLEGWSSDNPSLEITRCAAATYQLLGDSERAVSYWNKVLDLQPDNAEAHQYLADHYAKTGNVNKNLSHLLFILEKNPENSQVLKQIGQCYVGLKDFDRALPYFEKYIIKEPGDKGAVRFVVNIHAALGNKTETLRALEHYFTIESNPAKEQLGKAAILYGEKGYYRQAIGIYRRMLDISPDDPEILVGLANNFMEIGSEEEALAVWKQLAEIVPDVVDVYRPMADLLERMGRRLEFIDVMEVIHELVPDDISVVFRLAEAYMAEGELLRASAVLNKFAGPLPLSAEFFYLRAQVNYEIEDYDAAVLDFEKAISIDSGNNKAHFSCVLAYGRLGDQSMVLKHFMLLDDKEHLQIGQRLELAEAFAASGLYVWAREQVKIIVDLFSLAPKKYEAELVERAVVLAALTYERDDLFYEAEQCLRKGLIIVGQSTIIVPKLFRLALQTGRLVEAQVWLDYLRRESGDDLNVNLLEAELLAVSGQLRQFRNYVADVLHNLPEATDKKSKKYLLDMGAMLLQYGLLREAGDVASHVLSVDGGSLEALVVVQKVYAAGAYLPGRNFGEIDLEQLTTAQKISVVRLYGKYKMYKEMEGAVRTIIDDYYGSFSGRILLAESLVKQHKLALAKAELLPLTEIFPDNQGLLARLAQITFYIGELNEAFSYCQAALQLGKRSDITLLSARILWMQNKLDSSLRIYENFLEPSVFSDFEDLSKLTGFDLPIDYEKSSWLEFFGLSPDNQFPGRLVTGPDFMLSLLGRGETEHVFNLSVANDYAKYRWQEQLFAELQARKYVKMQEYYLAAKQFEYLLSRYPYFNIESITFDLAEVRGRLGKIGEEASAYEELLASGVSFPALPELVERNRLRRRPHAEVFSGYSKEEGRDDYINMQRDWYGAKIWFSPQTRHEAALEISRVNYHSTISDDVMRSSKAIASYKANVFTGLTVAVKGGFESMDDSGVDNFLLKAEGVGTLGDKLTGSLSYERDLMHDTVASIKRDITQQTIAGSMLFEPLARLALGGGYFATDYSDNNWTTGYDLKAGYVLLSEPTFLKIGYSYEFKESEDSAMPGAPAGDSFAPGDHPYWSPKNYWANQFGVEFKHLLSADSMGKWTSDRYYTAEYYLGHDSDGHAVQTAKGSLWYEINDKFNLKAYGELVSSTPYRKKELLLSVDYRW